MRVHVLFACVLCTLCMCECVARAHAYCVCMQHILFAPIYIIII